MNQQVIISQQLAQALHDYLMTRPMGEVEGLALGLRQASPLPKTDEKADPESDPNRPVPRPVAS